MFRAARLISDLSVSELKMVLAIERSPKERSMAPIEVPTPSSFLRRLDDCARSPEECSPKSFEASAHARVEPQETKSVDADCAISISGGFA
jgi:hypothetical protein